MNNSGRMTIIGFGVMGKKYSGLFSRYFDVFVFSARDVKSEVEDLGATFAADFADAIRCSDYILIAIPMDALDGIIERINKYARPETVVIDICSARMAASEKLSKLKCNHFGIHSDMVIGDRDEKIIECLKQTGHEFRLVSPEEHDRANSKIGLIHFIGLALDAVLDDDDRAILSRSPACTHMLKLIEHMKSNSPATYKETQIDNRFTAQKRKELIEQLVMYDSKLAGGDFAFMNDWR